MKPASTTENISPLGLVIVEELKRRNWTVSKLAVATGLSQAALSLIISEPTRVPNLPTLFRIAKALDKPLFQLIEVVGFDTGVKQLMAA